MDSTTIWNGQNSFSIAKETQEWPPLCQIRLIWIISLIFMKYSEWCHLYYYPKINHILETAYLKNYCIIGMGVYFSRFLYDILSDNHLQKALAYNHLLLTLRSGLDKSGLFGKQNWPNNILGPLFRPNKYKYTKMKTNNIKQ